MRSARAGTAAASASSSAAAAAPRVRRGFCGGSRGGLPRTERSPLHLEDELGGALERGAHVGGAQAAGGEAGPIALVQLEKDARAQVAADAAALEQRLEL